MPSIRFGLLVDGLSAPMLVLVSLVALLVQIYSLGYMESESPAGLGRYYAFHSLFATDDQKEGMAAFIEKREPQFRNS